MPAWVDKILIGIYHWVAIPILVARTKLPLEAFLVGEEALAHLLAADDKDEAVKNLKTKVRECTGVACPPELAKET